MKDPSAGLLAAAFIGITPGYISRSVAGSYDNEAIAIFLLMFTFYCWIKALKDGSALFGTIAAVFYFYMVAAWGMFHERLFSCYTNSLSLLRWICLHYEYDSPTCPCPHVDGSFLRPPLCLLLNLVCNWHISQYASPFRRFPTS